MTWSVSISAKSKDEAKAKVDQQVSETYPHVRSAIKGFIDAATGTCVSLLGSGYSSVSPDGKSSSLSISLSGSLWTPAEEAPESVPPSA